MDEREGGRRAPLGHGDRARPERPRVARHPGPHPNRPPDPVRRRPDRDDRSTHKPPPPDRNDVHGGTPAWEARGPPARLARRGPRRLPGPEGGRAGGGPASRGAPRPPLAGGGTGSHGEGGPTHRGGRLHGRRGRLVRPAVVRVHRRPPLVAVRYEGHRDQPGDGCVGYGGRERPWTLRRTRHRPLPRGLLADRLALAGRLPGPARLVRTGTARATRPPSKRTARNRSSGIGR